MATLAIETETQAQEEKPTPAQKFEHFLTAHHVGVSLSDAVVGKMDHEEWSVTESGENQLSIRLRAGRGKGRDYAVLFRASSDGMEVDVERMLTSSERSKVEDQIVDLDRLKGILNKVDHVSSVRIRDEHFKASGRVIDPLEAGRRNLDFSLLSGRIKTSQITRPRL